MNRLLAAGGVGLALGLGSMAAAQQFTQETATRFPSPNPTEFTNQLTIGDIDGDNDLDIIFANGGNFSSAGVPQVQRVFVNDGTGVFTDESDQLDFTGLCRGAELGDIDDDGDLDLLMVQDFQRPVKLFRNDGTGNFTDISGNLPTSNFSSSRGQFGDIDNDGDLDLYITDGGTNRFGCGQYVVYINDGTGVFTDETASRHPLALVCENMDCIFGDIDNDFDLDVRTGSTGTNNSRLYVNNGSGVFLQGMTPGDSSCYSYDFGDMNGDGYLDLIGANGGSGVTEILLVNDGTGRFLNQSGNLSPNPNQDDNDSKFFDYDNDGDLDLVIGRIGGAEKVYQNDGNGNYTQVGGILASSSDSTLDIMVGDMNNDGKIDIITAQGESGNYQNRIYINGGPADTLAPRIIKTEEVAPTAGVPTVVRALILDDMSSDRNFFDGGIDLVYMLDGAPPVSVPMKHSGGQVYRGVIPANSACALAYHVEARDKAGNLAVGPDVIPFAGAVPGDVNCDGSVDFEDLVSVLSAWGKCVGCPQDLDNDGNVGLGDLLIVLSGWTG